MARLGKSCTNACNLHPLIKLDLLDLLLDHVHVEEKWVHFLLSIIIQKLFLMVMVCQLHVHVIH